jgi:hypothetical protein
MKKRISDNFHFNILPMVSFSMGATTISPMTLAMMTLGILGSITMLTMTTLSSLNAERRSFKVLHFL